MADTSVQCDTNHRGHFSPMMEVCIMCRDGEWHCTCVGRARRWGLSMAQTGWARHEASCCSGGWLHRDGRVKISQGTRGLWHTLVHFGKWVVKRQLWPFWKSVWVHLHSEIVLYLKLQYWTQEQRAAMGCWFRFTRNYLGPELLWTDPRNILGILLFSAEFRVPHCHILNIRYLLPNPNCSHVGSLSLVFCLIHLLTLALAASATKLFLKQICRENTLSILWNKIKLDPKLLRYKTRETETQAKVI